MTDYQTYRLKYLFVRLDDIVRKDINSDAEIVRSVVEWKPARIVVPSPCQLVS